LPNYKIGKSLGFLKISFGYHKVLQGVNPKEAGQSDELDRPKGGK
jgi:hypothetical protein